MKEQDNMPLAQAWRDGVRARLGGATFDLVIVGGGINGAAIARDAALRQYSVALLEQNDFGFGTSSRSSRLIHGGLRYLEHGLVRLVFESVSERARLAKNARHIVRPLPFVFPVYKGQRGLRTMDMGLWIYDALALFRNYQNHEELTPLAATEMFPGLRAEGFQGGVLYYDYQTDDARLVLENVLSANAAGAACLSYGRVDAIAEDREDIRELEVRDLLSSASFTVRGRVVVLAAGPWTDRVLSMARIEERWLRGTKGVHIVVPRQRLPVGAALVMRHPEDGRMLFALPYFERTVIGTTDTDFAGDPAEVAATAEDVRYLLDSAGFYFPGAGLTADDVIATWAGVRPLLDPGEVKDPSAVSREHRIDARPDGLVVIAGGKLTTYRRMAGECVDLATELLAARGGPARRRHAATHRSPLPGAMGLESDAELEALSLRLERVFGDINAGRHVAYAYGARAERVAALVEEDRSSAAPIVEGLPYRWAEVTFAVREDLALTLADVLQRRTQIFYRAADQGLSVAAAVATRMGRELSWTPEERARQVAAYEDDVAANRRWRSGSRVAEELARGAKETTVPHDQ
jgi:glycerol-3-phosphate dehydrogenase